MTESFYQSSKDKKNIEKKNPVSSIHNPPQPARSLEKPEVTPWVGWGGEDCQCDGHCWPLGVERKWP